MDEQDEEEEEEEAPEPPEPTAAEIVWAGLAQGQLDKECVAIDQYELDEVQELIQKFVQDGCKCDFRLNKNSCSTNISLEHFWSVCCQMVELTHDELDWLFQWGDVFTPWAGERQVVYDLPPPRIEDLPEHLPVPPWHRLRSLYSH